VSYVSPQVVGSGQLDLVFVPGFVSNIDLFWDMPEWAYFFGPRSVFTADPVRQAWNRPVGSSGWNRRA
jgi:hypothetical protein